MSSVANDLKELGHWFAGGAAVGAVLLAILAAVALSKGNT